jgi:hypothetical protein
MRITLSRARERETEGARLPVPDGARGTYDRDVDDFHLVVIGFGLGVGSVLGAEVLMRVRAVIGGGSSGFSLQRECPLHTCTALETRPQKRHSTQRRHHPRRS